MFVFKTTLALAAILAVNCQQYNNGPTTTPVPILKQINKQNDDGSYSFGYEAADGSFKIETKYPNGDVAGKYGYVDQSGKLREVTYGASSQRGFEPHGSDIQVPPPTLNEPKSNALLEGEEDDGQYREDPKIYEDPKYNRGPATGTSFRQYHKASEPAGLELQEYQPRYTNTQSSYKQPTQYKSPIFQDTSFFNSAPQTFSERPLSQIFHQQPEFSFQTYNPQPYKSQPFTSQTYTPQPYKPQPFTSQTYTPQPYKPQLFTSQSYNTQPQSYNQYQNAQYQSNYNPHENYNPFFGHPAQNFDPSTGSYSINFTG